MACSFVFWMKRCFFSHSTKQIVSNARGELYLEFLQTFTKDLNPSVQKNIKFFFCLTDFSLLTGCPTPPPPPSPPHTLSVFVPVSLWRFASNSHFSVCFNFSIKVLHHSGWRDASKNKLSRQQSIKDAKHFYFCFSSSYSVWMEAIRAKLSNF